MPISYGTDKAAAVTRAHQLFRWFGLGWKVNADLPGTAGFDAASQFVREEDVESALPCGDDVAAVIEGAKEYADAGFTLVGLDGEAETDLAAAEGLTGPLVLVVGSEGQGLSRLVREACDTLAAIPIAATVESLNAGVAAGIALYEISRQRRVP